MAVVLAVVFAVLVFTFPHLKGWYEYGSYYEIYYPAAGYLKLAPLVWAISVIGWWLFARSWWLARRADKRRAQAKAEKERATAPLKSAAQLAIPQPQVVEEVTSVEEVSPPAVSPSPVTVATFFNELHARRAAKKEEYAQENYSRVLQRLRFEKLKEKSVCSIRGRSGRVLTLCKEGKKFVLIDLKKGRIEVELLSKNAEEAKLEALGY